MKSSFLLKILGIIIISISVYSYSFSLYEGFAIEQQKSEISTKSDQGKDDLILEVHNASTDPIVTKFLIGNEVYDQICPSHIQCSIEYDPSSSIIFSLPADNYPFMYHSFPFTINYNNLSKLQNQVTNNSIVNKSGKDYYSFKFLTGESTCYIDIHKSIVNEKQKVYYCEDNDSIDTSIIRIFDNKKWHFDTTEKYDAKSNIFTLYGTLRS